MASTTQSGSSLKSTSAFDTKHTEGPVEMIAPQKMGVLMWRPMLAMAGMGFIVAMILAGVRSGMIADADASDVDTIETLRHLVPGFMFLGFTGVFASVSFAIARILGVFRVGGSNVQDDVGKGVETLVMPKEGYIFLALMMMGMMALAIGSLSHIIAGFTIPSLEEADLLTSERWFLFGEGLRRLGVAVYLFGITMGLVTIIKVIRFQAIRIRELV